MLQIRKISIKNFKQYKSVDIKPEIGPGLFIFIGKNKLGKSNFLNAICWCLYEELPFRESLETSEEASGLLNEDTEKEGEFEEIKVQIDIQDNEKIYQFTRTSRKGQDSKFSVMRKDAKGDWAVMSNEATIVENFLPHNLRQYFIFAGENVEELFSTGYDKKLKEGVDAISHIGVLDRAISHLGIIYADIMKSATRGNVSLEKEEEQLNELISSTEENKVEFKRIISELEKLYVTRTEINKTVASYAKYTELVKNKEFLSERLDAITKEESVISEQVNNKLLSKAPFLYVRDTLLHLEEKLKKDEDDGLLPPMIRADFIKELLDHGTCICGREIEKDKEAYSHLLSLLSSTESVDKKTPLSYDRFQIRQIINSMFDFRDDLQSLRVRKLALVEERNKNELQLKSISVELQNAPEGQVSGLENRFKRLEEQMDDLKREKAKLEIDINKGEEAIKVVQGSIKDGLAKKKESERATLKLKYTEESIVKLKYIREKITNRVRKALSLNIEKYFRNLFWEHDAFQKIEFTENYKLVAVKSDMDRATTEFSRGEKKALGLATLKAIAELSGFRDVPIFFDAPLSNLDTEVQMNVLNMLPTLAPQKQVFVFNLDDIEMTDFMAARPSVGRYYTLKRDKQNSKSTLIEPN